MSQVMMMISSLRPQILSIIILKNNQSKLPIPKLRFNTEMKKKRFWKILH